MVVSRANDNIIVRLILNANTDTFIQATLPQVPNEPDELYLFIHDEPAMRLEHCERLLKFLKRYINDI